MYGKVNGGRGKPDSCCSSRNLLGAFLGFLNGLLVNVTGLHPFIITLGTQAIYRGVTLIISNSSAVYGFPASFTRVISNLL